MYLRSTTIYELGVFVEFLLGLLRVAVLTEAVRFAANIEFLSVPRIGVKLLDNRLDVEPNYESSSKDRLEFPWVLSLI